MDFTPKLQEGFQDSGCVSTSFDASVHLFESTPKSENHSTPLSYNPRKRKAVNYDIDKGRRLCDVLESCPSTPQFSSTLNESLSTNLANCHIEQSYYKLSDDICQPQKLFRDNESNHRIRSVPATPEKQIKNHEEILRKPNNSFIKSFSTVSVQSPLKEQHDILYPNLKPLEPVKKPLTPQKFKERVDKNFSPAKKCLFTVPRTKLLEKVVSNTVIMGNIFKYLSSGDLYRVSMVSKSLRKALEHDCRAQKRYTTYLDLHRINKENYKITPPSSPQNQELFTGSSSPGSRNFKEFYDIGSLLKENQSLTKCPGCGKPSVVERNIAQCQEILICGYIFCQKCDSFAYKPEEFVDKCQNSLLLTNNNNKPRRRLEDLSNSINDISDTGLSISAIFTSTLNSSSGYISGYESSHTSITVRRNLNKSFDINDSHIKPRVLVEKNRLQNQHVQQQKRKSFVTPVVQNEKPKKNDIIEPSSPPKVTVYAIGSKQSKRNLKRLTR